MSCWFDALWLLKFLITLFASLPSDLCALIAANKSLVRPS